MRPMHRIALVSVAVAVFGCEDTTTPTGAPEVALHRRGGSEMVGPSPIGSPITIGVQLLADGLTSPITIVSADDRTGRTNREADTQPGPDPGRGRCARGDLTVLPLNSVSA